MQERSIFPQIWQEIESDKILLLNGARQIGKTSLMQMIREKLITDQKVPADHIHWFDLEKVEDLSIWSNQTAILSILPINDQTKHYIFIDEFQLSLTIGATLKVLHDHHPQFKIIITGSASWYLSLDESMAGRKRVFAIWPLDFPEYLTWKNERLLKYYQLGNQNPNQLTLEIVQLLNTAYVDFIRYGGYPAVVKTDNRDEKIKILEELLNSYILKDIQLHQFTANSLQVKKLLTLLASQAGSLLDIPGLALNSGLKRGVLENRLDLLQNTFIAHFVRPYFTNKTKELVKNPKIYLIDSGLRQFLLNNFSVQPKTASFGQTVENAIIVSLLKTWDPLKQIYYWRTKSGQEVDIIIKKSEALIPIEIKAGDANQIPAGIKSFINQYKPSHAYVLNWSIIESQKYQSCQVDFRPLWFVPSLALNR